MQVDCKTKLLSSKEAAAFMGVSINTIYNLNHKKKLKPLKPGGKKTYYRKSDLEAYLESGEKGKVEIKLSTDEVDYFEFWKSKTNHSVAGYAVNLVDYKEWERLLKNNVIVVGEWRVLKDASLMHISENGYEYYIDSDRLGENWIAHLLGVKWCDMNHFVRAYKIALEKKGIDFSGLKYNF